MIAVVTQIETRKKPFGQGFLSSVKGTFRAIGTNGVSYLGTHNGPGVFCRLRPAKVQP